MQTDFCFLIVLCFCRFSIFQCQIISMWHTLQLAFQFSILSIFPSFHVEFSICGIFSMWHFLRVAFSPCGIFSVWHFLHVAFSPSIRYTTLQNIMRYQARQQEGNGQVTKPYVEQIFDYIFQNRYRQIRLNLSCDFS